MKFMASPLSSVVEVFCPVAGGLCCWPWRCTARVLAQERAVPSLARGDHVESFAPVVKKAAPAVVNIFSKRQVVQPARDLSRPCSTTRLFKRFFGDDFSFQRTRPKKRMQNSPSARV